MGQRVKELIVLFVTMSFAGFAGGLLINAGIGSDTVTVFLDGLSRTLQWSVGSVALLFNIVLVSLGFLLARKDMGWLSVAFSLGVGFFLDAFIGVLAQFDLHTTPMVVRLGFVVVAQVSFAFANGLLIHFKSGMNPIDSIAYRLVSLFGLSFRASRTIIDGLLIGSGFVMGGVVGIGSVISFLTMGTLVALMCDILSKISKQT